MKSIQYKIFYLICDSIFDYKKDSVNPSLADTIDKSVEEEVINLIEDSIFEYVNNVFPNIIDRELINEIN